MISFWVRKFTNQLGRGGGQIPAIVLVRKPAPHIDRGSLSTNHELASQTHHLMLIVRVHKITALLLTVPTRLSSIGYHALS